MHEIQFPAGTPVLKDESVRVQGIRPEMVLAFLAASRIWGELGYPVTYTSIAASGQPMRFQQLARFLLECLVYAA